MPYRTSAVQFATESFHLFYTLPVWEQNLNFKNICLFRNCNLLSVFQTETDAPRQNVVLQNNHSKTSINWSSSTCKYTAIKCGKLKSLFHQKTSEKNNWRVFLSVSIYPIRVCKDSLVQNGSLKLSTLFHVVVHKDFKHSQTCTF